MELDDLVITVLSSSAVTGLGIFLTQTWMKAGINNYYTKKLNKFNEEITIQAEIRKQDIDKKFYDFTLYSTKRHDIYPELYKQLYKIYSQFDVIKHLVIVGINSVSSKGDIGVIFGELQQSFSLDTKTINELKALPNDDTDKENLNKTIKQVKNIIKKNGFINLASDLKNTDDFFSENMLYYSKEILNEVAELLKDLGTLLDDKFELSVRDFNGYLDYEAVEKEDKLHNVRYIELYTKLNLLRQTMQKELSISSE
ncbi:hypothetical protein ACSS31_27130 (plasmid) [Priestia megaterium]